MSAAKAAVRLCPNFFKILLYSKNGNFQYLFIDNGIFIPSGLPLRFCRDTINWNLKGKGVVLYVRSGQRRRFVKKVKGAVWCGRGSGDNA